MERVPQDTFQDELELCISLLEANLHLSPTSKKAEETQHILKVLRSCETPFVKKQQVMHHVFGDCRLKMAEDQRSMEKADVKPGGVEVQQSNEQASDGVVYGKPSDQTSEAKPDCFTSSNNSFHIDFTLSETDPGAPGTPLEAVPGVHDTEQIQTNVRAHTGSAPKEDRSPVMLKIPQPETALGDETVTEKSTADGAAQKKKKKKKQKTSVGKKEIEETETNRKAKVEASRCQNKDMSHQDKASQRSDDQLWKEVNWCVEQLELGLKTQKATPKQAEEALRAIKTLRNDKAPLVKKRQLMRAMFGDYRKKMEEERCKMLKLMEAAVKSARIVEVKRSVCNKSCQFIRKSSGACRKSQGLAESPSESPRTLNIGSFKFTTSQEEFHFNFF